MRGSRLGYKFGRLKRAVLSTVILGATLAVSGQAAVIGHWSFDEASGTNAVDDINGNTAIIKGTNCVTWVTTNGVVGGAAKINGTTSSGGSDDSDCFHVTIPEMSGATALTVSCWFKPVAFKHSWDRYMGVAMTRTMTSNDSADHGNWGMAMNDAYAIDSRIVGKAMKSSNNSITMDAWYHVVMTWDPAAGERHLYVNGLADMDVDATLLSDATSITASGEWCFGRDPSELRRTLDGWMDDYTIWDEALAATNVLALYAEGISGVPGPDADLEFQAVLITDEPVNASRAFGDYDAPVSFTVGALGVQEYYWYYDAKDGSGFQDDPWQTLDSYTDYGFVIPKDYYCVVHGFDGTTVTSATVTVTEDAPGIVEGSQSVAPGTAVTITADLPYSASNPTPFTFEWYKDGAILAGEVSSQVVYNSITPEQAGSYSVDVTWGSSNMMSEAVSVVIAEGMSADLAAYWPMDDTNGSVAVDAVFENDAVWRNTSGSGLTWVDGMVGGAADMAGGSYDRSFRAPNALVGGADELTMSVWMYGRSTGSYYGVLGVRPIDDEPNGQWMINAMPSDGHIDFRFAGQSLKVEGAYAPNTWQHLVMTWNKATSTGKCYIDGVEVASSDGFAYDFGGVEQICIGDDRCCSGRELNAILDEAAIWSRELSATEVAALYNGGRASVAIPEIPVDGGLFIVEEPVSTSRIYGDLATTNVFTVGGAGVEPITYQWRVDGVDVAGATGTELAIANLVTGDYDCVVANSSSVMTSAVVNITEYLNDLLPATQDVRAGNPATMVIDMPVNPAYTFQWKKDGVDAGAPSAASLTIDPVAAADIGNYTVVVSLPGQDPMESSVSHLNVTGATVLTLKNAAGGYQGVEDTTILSNNTGDRDDNYGGRGEVIVGDTAPGGIGTRTGLIRFAVDGVADSLASVQSMKLRMYLSQSRMGGASALTNDVTVQVYRISDANADWVEGTENGNPQAGTASYNDKAYQGADWAGGAGMPTAGTDYVDDLLAEFVLPAGVTGMTEVAISPSSFTLMELLQDWNTNNGGFVLNTTNSGPFQVFWHSTENGDPELAPALIMEVVGNDDKPIIMEQPEDVEIELGSTAPVTFSVGAIGQGPFTYQWYYENGVAIADEITSSLTIDPVTAADAGGYYAQVGNFAGERQSRVAQLALTLPPVSPVAMAVLEGGYANFSITMSAGTGFTYQWSKDGAAIPGATSEMLTIAAAAAQDAGVYTVAVTQGGETLVSSESTLSIMIAGPGEELITLGGNKTGSADDVQDTELDSWAPDSAFGGRWEFGCRVNDGTGHGVVKFPELLNLDPASIGEIKGAVLRLKLRVYYSGEESARSWDNIQVRKILDAEADWLESPDNNVTITGFSTYNNKVHSSTDWAGGGTFGASKCEDEVLGRIVWDTVPAGVDQIVDIPLSGDLSFILDWITGDAPNSGLALIAGSKSTSGEGRVAFYSSEAAAATNAAGEVSYPNAEGPQLILLVGAPALEMGEAVIPEDGKLELTWNSVEGNHSYAVEATADLAGGTWEPLVEDILPTPPANTQIVDMVEGMMSYRVVQLPPPPIYFENFEDGVNGWTTSASGTGSGTVWELGTPNAQGSAGFDLTTASSPNNAWGTGIASGSYANNVTLTLTSPIIDLSAVTGPVTISFMEALQLESSNQSLDYVKVTVLSAAGDEELSERKNMTIADWTKSSLPFDASAHGSVQLQFEFFSDPTNVNEDYAGWFIDDVKID